MTDDDAKHYKVKIDEANLFVPKMTLSYYVLGGIEKTLVKTQAKYRYNEVISKAFLGTAGQQSWKQKDVFIKEPIQRPIIVMSARAALIATNIQNPFSYQPFGLNELTVHLWEPWLPLKVVTVYHWLIFHAII